MSINIIKQYSTANTTSSPGRSIQYIAIHYTAGTSSATGNARANASWFGNPAAQASADFVVDDTEIVQINGDIRNRYCWAVGGRESAKYGGELYGIAKNSNTISIEICSNNKLRKMTYPNDPNYYFTDAAVNNAIELTKYLMKEYNIDADHVVRHYSISGKLCPGISGWNKDSGDDSKWLEFKEKIKDGYEEPKWYRVRLKWSDESSQKGAFINLDKAKECADQNPGYTVFDVDGNAVYTSKGLPSIDSVISNQTKEKSIAFLATLPDYKGLPESKEDYLNKVAELVVKMYPYTLILPSVVIAQAFLENGGGISLDAIELTKRNNLIGQKAELINNTWKNQTVWDGQSFKKKTPEVDGGVPTIIVDSFRIFKNYAYSLLDYEMFLTHVRISDTQYKYRSVVGMTDPLQMITKISQSGYATDPRYITSVMRIIEEHNLTRYDKMAIKALQDEATPDIPTPTPSPEPVPEPTPEPTPAPVDPDQGKQKYYRVQVGVFSTDVSRNILINDIKAATDLSCFSEEVSGRYYVYCGSFQNIEIAKERIDILQSNGFDAFIKEVFV